MPGCRTLRPAMLSCLLAAAKRRQALSSVASIAAGYEGSLRPSLACFSLAMREAT
jgi:hypothetical protein